jgi:SAM-dependent MidA family methyltransferase
VSDVSAPSLEAEIRRRIGVAGPMPVRQYMTLCLSHPEHGYYMTRDPFGRTGDFVTAPEVSQMFGELIGLWAASVWQQMGAPENVRLVELGPGRGTMMMDALRAAQVAPDFRKALVVHLVEVSPELKRRQEQTLAGIDVPMLWHASFDEVPAGPLIILANEFFDALPIHQAVKQINGWYERTVEIDSDDNLTFGIAADQIPLFEQLLPPQLRDAPIGTLYEWRNDNLPLELSRRVMREGGAGLIIDYGHVESAAGDTLQAVGKHAYADLLSTPGEVDLTAHVDFQALTLALDSMGAAVYGPIQQGQFLRRLGIEKRAMALKATAREKAAGVDAAVARLTGETRTGMGRMFKVVAFGAPALGVLPGFER